MKIKELVGISARSNRINCFEEYTNNYDEYTAETKVRLDEKEVSMIECSNGQELSIYYIN